jgi:predicted acetyltransferase
VEGYPHEISDKKMSSSFLSNGTRGLYERVGFEYVRPKGLTELRHATFSRRCH